MVAVVLFNAAATILSVAMGAPVSIKYSAVSVAALLLLASTSVFASCPAPAQPGLHICFPTSGSSVSQAIFEFGWNVNGAAVTHFQLFDNGKLIDDEPGAFATLIDGAIHDGHHNVTAKITDSGGKQFSASVSFTQSGFDPSFDCSLPTSGIHLCSPNEGGIDPLTTPLVMSIKAASRITAWSIFVNGKLQQTGTASSATTSLVTSVNSVPGKNVVTLTAKDAAGHKYTSTHHYTAFFPDFECVGLGDVCFPGIEIQQPTAPDTAESFRFQATVRDNPSPITAMNVYLDGNKVAHSSGPTVITTIHASHGSHVVTVVAYDTKGHFYELNPTYNVN